MLGPAPDYDVFLRNAKPALLSCMQNHITHVILTTWGDDGGETSPQAMLLGFQYYAEFCYRQTFDKQHVCSRLLSCTGADGNALSLLSSFYKTDLLSPESDLPMVQNSCYIKTLYWESLTWISKEWDLPHSTQI